MAVWPLTQEGRDQPGQSLGRVPTPIGVRGPPSALLHPRGRTKSWALSGRGLGPWSPGRCSSCLRDSLGSAGKSPPRFACVYLVSPPCNPTCLLVPLVQGLPAPASAQSICHQPLGQVIPAPETNGPGPCLVSWKPLSLRSQVPPDLGSQCSSPGTSGRDVVLPHLPAVGATPLHSEVTGARPRSGSAPGPLLWSRGVWKAGIASASALSTTSSSLQGSRLPPPPTLQLPGPRCPHHVGSS